MAYPDRAPKAKAKAAKDADITVDQPGGSGKAMMMRASDMVILPEQCWIVMDPKLKPPPSPASVASSATSVYSDTAAILDRADDYTPDAQDRTDPCDETALIAARAWMEEQAIKWDQEHAAKQAWEAAQKLTVNTTGSAKADDVPDCWEGRAETPVSTTSHSTAHMTDAESICHHLRKVDPENEACCPSVIVNNNARPRPRPEDDDAEQQAILASHWAGYEEGRA